MTAFDPAATLAAADQRQISGDLSGAIALYDQVLAHTPALWPAHVNRGLALAISGDLLSGRRGFRHALAIYPSAAPALRNLADSLVRDRPEAGLLLARAFAAVAPGAAEAWLCIGATELKLDRSRTAARALRRTIALSPALIDGLIAFSGTETGSKSRWLWRAVGCEAAPLPLLALARHLVARRDLGSARRLLRRAISVSPAGPEIVSELTAAIDGFAATAELARWGRRAVTLAPSSAAVWNNFGTAQLGLGQLLDADRSFKAALVLHPNFAEAHFNRATPLFLLDRPTEAWDEYEWRWRISRFERPPSAKPRWRGQPLGERRLVVHDEQGLGDALHFARYLPLLPKRQGDVTFVCDPRLVRLFRATFDDIAISPRPDVPDHDLAVPLLGLPVVLGPDADPPPPPYVALPEPHRIDADGRLRVGLVWGGNPDHPRDRERSMPLDFLAPWLDLADVAWFSLQTGPPRRDIQRLGLDRALPDVGTSLGDLFDTASVLGGLDLLITVDTAACHLAGALGLPVWTLLTWLPDWRWGMLGTTTTWYPSMHLFRQARRGDWASVVEDVHAALSLRSARRPSAWEQPVSP